MTIGRPIRLHPLLHLMRVCKSGDGLLMWECYRDAKGAAAEAEALRVMAEWFRLRATEVDRQVAALLDVWIRGKPPVAQAGPSGDSRGPAVAIRRTEQKELQDAWSDRRDLW